jgi:hypothetical protein
MEEQNIETIKRGRGRPRKIVEEPIEPIEPIEAKKRGRPPLPPDQRKPPKPRKPRNSPNPTGRPRKYSTGIKKNENGYDYKQYYLENKKYLLTKINCDCGSRVARHFMNRHKKLPIHIRNLENLD